MLSSLERDFIGFILSCFFYDRRKTHPPLQEKPSFRLPREVIPSHYDVKIQTHLAKSKPVSFHGRVKITVRAVRETLNVTLHAKKLDIRRVVIKDLEAAAAAASSASEEAGVPVVETDAGFSSESDNNDFLVITAESPLKKGREYVLEIHFSGFGGGMENTGVFRASERVFVTQFGPTHARRAFPCFDEPDLKAKFKIVITCDERFTAISNMELEEGMYITIFLFQATWGVCKACTLVPPLSSAPYHDAKFEYFSWIVKKKRKRTVTKVV